MYKIKCIKFFKTIDNIYIIEYLLIKIYYIDRILLLKNYIF